MRQLETATLTDRETAFREADGAEEVEPSADWEGSLDRDTLETEVTQAIGHRMREERLRLGLTLQEVARRAGLSVGMASKIENARISPSLRTIARLSQALEIPVTAFFRGFEEERDASLVRAGEGLVVGSLGRRRGHRYELLAAPRASMQHMQPILVTLTERTESFPLFQHNGAEFLFVLEGELVYRYGGHKYAIRRGDSLTFDGRVPHGPESLIEVPIRYLSVAVSADDK